MRLPIVTGLLLLGACSSVPPQGRTPYVPTPGMARVLEQLQEMHPRPLASLSAERAREVPGLVEAARAIENVKGLPAPSTDVPQVTALVASGAEGPLAARLYRPVLAKDTPVIVYFPGGSWVTGSLDQYEETARELSARTGWVVVSIRTRRAPEDKFPAAHDDALAAYQWARGSMRSWGADPARVVLAGEGPGGNLALSTALLARDRGIAVPDHLLLISPQVTTALDSPSMSENRDSRPLTRRTLDWAQDAYTEDSRALRDPRLDLLPRRDFAQMPPATIVLAEIDPLRSEGETLGVHLREAGVPVDVRVFAGVTHDFFGLGQTVPEAGVAETYAAERMTRLLSRPALPVLRGAVPRHGRALRVRARRR